MVSDITTCRVPAVPVTRWSANPLKLNGRVLTMSSPLEIASPCEKIDVVAIVVAVDTRLSTSSVKRNVR